MCDVTQTQAPPYDYTDIFYHRLALSELSSVHHCFDAGAGIDKNGS